jgi:beta-lactamase class A
MTKVFSLMVLVLVCVTFSALTIKGRPGFDAAVRGRVDALIARSGSDVAVGFHPLDGRDELLIRPDEEFHAASTMKILVRELCEAMITVSSNFATNLLIERLGAKRIQQTVNDLGAPGMRVLRGVEDDKAFQKGLNNTTTARALMTLLLELARGEAVDRHASDQMIAVLERQTFKDRIPAGLPGGTRVAHKTGEITKIQHDAAIVYARRPFVLVVLVRGQADPKAGSTLIADVTRALYDASQP